MSKYYIRLGNNNKERLTKAMELLRCSKEELPYLLGQIDVESMGFTCLRENLYYTSLDRLKIIFTRLRKQLTKAHVRNPKALGELLYGKFEYSGYGGIQLTWEANHKAFFRWVGEPMQYADITGDKEMALRHFWLTSAYYFSLMKPKLALLPPNLTVGERATHYGRLINRGLESNARFKPLHNDERIALTVMWMGVVDNAI